MACAGDEMGETASAFVEESVAEESAELERRVEPEPREDGAGPSALAPAGPGATPFEQPFQVTVHDEDELDPTDPTILQVPAPKGSESWVLEGAKALVAEAGGDPSDLGQVVAAQRLFAAMARADATAIVEVTSLSEPDPESIDALREVGFATVAVVAGDEVPKGWSARLSDQSSCGQPAPPLGSRWLVFLDVGGGKVALRTDRRRAIEGGKLEVSPGLVVTPDGLDAAVVAAAEGVP